MCRVAPSPLPSEALSARAVLPNTDDVAARVADHRDPQIAFWVRLFHEICARSRGLFKRFVEFFDEDVRPHPTLAGHGVIGPGGGEHAGRAGPAGPGPAGPGAPP